MSTRQNTVLSLLFLTICGCGIYTFDKSKLGSSLPEYIKTVDMPLFTNNSMKPEIADIISSRLIEKVVSENTLEHVSSGGDATISGVVKSYRNHPYTYGSEDYREVDISEYAVKILVDVKFVDNRKNEPIFEGMIEGEGVYDYDNETEDQGRDRAIDDIIEQILQKSIQGW